METVILVFQSCYTVPCGHTVDAGDNIVCNTAQTLEDHISTSKGLFSTIFDSLENPLSPVPSDAKIIKNETLYLDLWSTSTCAVLQTVINYGHICAEALCADSHTQTYREHYWQTRGGQYVLYKNILNSTTLTDRLNQTTRSKTI